MSEKDHTQSQPRVGGGSPPHRAPDRLTVSHPDDDPVAVDPGDRLRSPAPNVSVGRLQARRAARRRHRRHATIALSVICGLLILVAAIGPGSEPTTPATSSHRPPGATHTTPTPSLSPSETPPARPRAIPPQVRPQVRPSSASAPAEEAPTRRKGDDRRYRW